MDQAQITVGSASDDCRVCMQKKNGLCTQFCSSTAAEEASEIFCIMIEFSHDLQII